MGISAIDFWRLEASIVLFNLHNIDVYDEDIERWETVEHMVQTVVLRSEQSFTEASALAMLRHLLANGWGVEPVDIVPGAKLFEPPLRLDWRGWYREWSYSGQGKR